MPEGPECHLAALHLEQICKDKLITSIDIHGGRYQKHGPFDGFDTLKIHINEGTSRVKAVGSRGKLIIMFFDNSWCILCTLGLKGAWTSKKTKHCDVSIDVDAKQRLWFKDQMHYGTLKYVDLEETICKMKSLGPDVTVKDKAFTQEYLRTIVQKYPKWDLAKLLMDQSKMSGIGNYLKAEILYRCKLAPMRMCETLLENEISIYRQFLIYHMLIGIVILVALLYTFRCIIEKKTNLDLWWKNVKQKMDVLAIGFLVFRSRYYSIIIL